MYPVFHRLLRVMYCYGISCSSTISTVLSLCVVEINVMELLNACIGLSFPSEETQDIKTDTSVTRGRQAMVKRLKSRPFRVVQYDNGHFPQPYFHCKLTGVSVDITYPFHLTWVPYVGPTHVRSTDRDGANPWSNTAALLGPAVPHISFCLKMKSTGFPAVGAKRCRLIGPHLIRC